MQPDDLAARQSASRVWKNRANGILRSIFLAKRDGDPSNMRDIALWSVGHLIQASVPLRTSLQERVDRYVGNEESSYDRGIEIRLSLEIRVDSFKRRTVEGAALTEIDLVLPEAFRLLGEAELFVAPAEAELENTPKSTLINLVRGMPLNYLTIENPDSEFSREVSFATACQLIGQLALVKNERVLTDGRASDFVEQLATDASFKGGLMARDLMVGSRVWTGLGLSYNDSPELLWTELGDELRYNPYLQGSSAADS